MHGSRFRYKAIPDVLAILNDGSRHLIDLTSNFTEKFFLGVRFGFVTKTLYVRGRRNTFDVRAVTIRTVDPMIGQLFVKTFNGIKPSFKSPTAFASTIKNFQNVSFVSYTQIIIVRKIRAKYQGLNQPIGLFLRHVQKKLHASSIFITTYGKLLLTRFH